MPVLCPCGNEYSLENKYRCDACAEAGYRQREYKMKNQIKELEAELALKDKVIQVLFQDDHAYNTMSVLEHLIEATEHLLTDHSCDQDGYEMWEQATKRGKEILKEWATAKAKESPGQQQTAMSDKLKPCPFCGSIPTLEDDGIPTLEDDGLERDYWVECKCGVESNSDKKKVVVDQWNTRTEDNAIRRALSPEMYDFIEEVAYMVADADAFERQSLKRTAEQLLAKVETDRDYNPEDY